MRSRCWVSSVFLVLAAAALGYPLLVGVPYHHQRYVLLGETPAEIGGVRAYIAVRALSGNACGTRSSGPYRVRLLLESNDPIDQVEIEELRVVGPNTRELMRLREPTTFQLAVHGTGKWTIDEYVGPQFDATCENADQVSVNLRLRFTAGGEVIVREYRSRFACEETRGCAPFNPFLDAT